MTVYKGTGCSICSGTGYKGRVALYEVMAISDRIRDLILNGASTERDQDRGRSTTACTRCGAAAWRRSGWARPRSRK